MSRTFDEMFIHIHFSWQNIELLLFPILSTKFSDLLSLPLHIGMRMDIYIYIYKCKNIFTKMLKDVGMEVLKSIETRSKFSMHADKGRG